jgi:hypothetical protein
MTPLARQLLLLCLLVLLGTPLREQVLQQGLQEQHLLRQPRPVQRFWHAAVCSH